MSGGAKTPRAAAARASRSPHRIGRWERGGGGTLRLTGAGTLDMRAPGTQAKKLYALAH
jgi:hypothetical protein